MAAVRRDSRGIVLEKGESQDKSGKYRLQIL
ncbi:MAG: integrase DNA-binding domain-containing protein [Blautia massiliensis (ex Durand et al. 2017)]